MFWQCSLLFGSASSLKCNQSASGVVHLGLPSPSSGRFVKTKNVCQHKIVIKGGTLQESESSLLCFVIAEGSANALLVFIKHPCSLLNSSLLAQQECPSSVSDQ